MADTAPVCHIAPVDDPQQPSPQNLPSIPPAQPNLASLVQTVNAMRQTIIILAGQQGVAGAQGAAGQNASAKGTWTENRQARVTEKVKIYDPSDNTRFVEVDRVNALQMVNKATGQTWVWSR